MRNIFISLLTILLIGIILSELYVVYETRNYSNLITLKFIGILCSAIYFGSTYLEKFRK